MQRVIKQEAEIREPPYGIGSDVPCGSTAERRGTIAGRPAVAKITRDGRLRVRVGRLGLPRSVNEATLDDGTHFKAGGRVVFQGETERTR